MKNGKPYQGSPERNPDERIPLSIFSPYFEKCVLPELKAYAMSGKISWNVGGFLEGGL